MLELTLEILISAGAAILVVLIHELVKYYFSLMMLHPIHRKRNDYKVRWRKYIDPIGLIFFIFTNVGWQKPGEYKVEQFKNREKSLLHIMVAGFAASGIFMMVLIPVYTYFHGNVRTVFAGYSLLFLFRLIQFNFSLIIVNLFPIPPLNMAKIIRAIHPNTYFRLIQNQRILHAVFILFIAFNLLSSFVQILFVPVFRLLI